MEAEQNFDVVIVGGAFVTFDYRRFCQAMLAQTDADVWQARVTLWPGRRKENRQ